MQFRANPWSNCITVTVTRCTCNSTCCRCLSQFGWLLINGSAAERSVFIFINFDSELNEFVFAFMSPATCNMQHTAEPRGKCSVTNAQKLNFRLGTRYNISARCTRCSTLYHTEMHSKLTKNTASVKFCLAFRLAAPFSSSSSPLSCSLRSISTLSTLTRSAEEQV